MELDIYQLMTMRSLLSQGWPASMVGILLERCSLNQAGWDALLKEGWVELDKENKYQLSCEGKKQYKTQKKGKWF